MTGKSAGFVEGLLDLNRAAEENRMRKRSGTVPYVAFRANALDLCCGKKEATAGRIIRI